MKKVSSVFLYIFAVGVILAVLAGALSFLGYVAAMIIGGDTAANICKFIYSQYFPLVIQISSISVGFGLLGMYLQKMKALSMDNQNNAAGK